MRRSPFRACRSSFNSFRKGALVWNGIWGCPVLCMEMLLRTRQSCWGGQFAIAPTSSNPGERDDMHQAKEGFSLFLKDGQRCGSLDYLHRMVCKSQLPQETTIFPMRNVNMEPWRRRYLFSFLPHNMQPKASKPWIKGRR